MSRNIKELIKKMTLEEKAGLCSGLDNWHTKPIKRLDIPSIMVADGPHGLRKQDDRQDNLGINRSVPATCFPSGSALACSWDRDLVEKVGETLGEECQAEGVSILLGPAANIKRSPLCGRNFEYFSEDPYLSSQMAKSHIKGVQSKGVGTSLKHFAANNQECRRMSINEHIDERTLREIYLASFEAAVKESHPWTVMCSYNRINGEFSSQNKKLLTDVLRDEWKYEGFVMSDWGAVYEREKGVEAGLDLEMPYSFGIGDKKIVQAVKEGKLDEKALDRTVQRILEVVFKAVQNKKKDASYDKAEHHKIARKTAGECMVLLKNEDDVLPLKKGEKIAVIGAFAENPRYQGGGSSHINPTKVDNIIDEITKAGDSSKVFYAKGFELESDDVSRELFDEAKKTASKCDKAVIFAGLPARYESEGYDRQHMRIPQNQVKLIEEVAKVQKNVIVFLSNGSPIEMPWLQSAKAVIEGYLGGQAEGGAAADILFGNVNPSGKLAETFPKKLSDNPSYLNFPGEGDDVYYNEGLFVGYRYYDKKEIEPLFPFGYGLSYTKFEYEDISVDKEEITDDDILKVQVKVKNTGKVPGKEIVELYVHDEESSVIRPVKELKGFEKVELQPGEEKVIEFKLGKRAFAYYNTYIKDWYVENGCFDILVGSSSRDIKLKKKVNVKSSFQIRKRYTVNSTVEDVLNNPKGRRMMEEFLGKSMGTQNSEETMGTDPFEMMKYNVLRTFYAFNGEISEKMVNDFIDKLNKEK